MTRQSSWPCCLNPCDGCDGLPPPVIVVTFGAVADTGNCQVNCSDLWNGHAFHLDLVPAHEGGLGFVDCFYFYDLESACVAGHPVESIQAGFTGPPLPGLPDGTYFTVTIQESGQLPQVFFTVLVPGAGVGGAGKPNCRFCFPVTPIYRQGSDSCNWAAATCSVTLP
jgi:hypothetical protein